MADSDDRRRKRRREAGSGDTSQADLIRALNHELRRRILRLLNELDDPISPVQLARQLNKSLSNVSYHVAVLKRLGAVTEVGHQPVRGAIEHFYVSAVRKNEKVLAMLEATKEEDAK